MLYDFNFTYILGFCNLDILFKSVSLLFLIGLFKDGEDKEGGKYQRFDVA